MNLGELRDECRDRARDIQEPRLWSDDEMARYINRVERRIAREAKCIRDAVTPEICLIESTPVPWETLVPGTLDHLWANDPGSWIYQKNVAPYRYPLDSRIIAVDEVKWVGKAWKLTRVSVAKWQRNVYWERVCGMPTEYALDLSANTIALNYRASDADHLQLVVRRLPLKKMEYDEDVPEIRESYHDFMVYGILALMYQKQDAETFDKVKAMDYEALFMRDLDRVKRDESLLDERLHANAAHAAFR